MVTIMSFLSVEKAARLRVVCRQWNELWETMIGFTPRLKFARRKTLKIWKTNSLEYVKGVDEAMKLNTKTSQIDLEELIIEVPLDKFFSDDVNRWVEFGVKRRELSMKSLDVGDNDTECIFTNSPNLERLSVENSDILEKFEVAYNNTLELIQPNPFLCFNEGFPQFDPYRELFGQLKRLCFKISREVEHLEVELLPSKNGPLPSSWDLLQAAPVVHNLSIQWVDNDTPMKAKANTKYWGSHQNLEVVKLAGFSGCKKEVELVLNLVEIAASLKKIIIQFLPSECWPHLSLEQVNQNIQNMAILNMGLNLLLTEVWEVGCEGGGTCPLYLLSGCKEKAKYPRAPEYFVQQGEWYMTPLSNS
ncbi:hypothetical protein FEM48_Zijuj05G0010700 [Ziziphus jujuba var. spinosa]|uniref:F-box domain-containing protein n=1 Tax=Ziziphus jujuba var. spinosa TaxID=714518 RepID=A0A978VBW5_ZIZJJ|nr:hypothetical protein FEM48_Zijuj05G0010700 [Ziziphus jujuba var. spinosa]